MAEIRHYLCGGTAVIEAPATFDIYAAPQARELSIRLTGLDGSEAASRPAGGAP